MSTTPADNPTPVPHAGLAPGDQLAHYRIIRQVGVGGMGVVYLARDVELDRDVALKLLRPDVIADPRSTESHDRFIREARAAARLSHPNVGSIFQVGRNGAQVFIAMEWLDGGSLADYLRQHVILDWREATAAVRDACAGLAAAHAAGLVHRDIKPSNLMRTRAGVVKLVDFGLARVADAEFELTQTGAVLGTPAYLSPEQCRGERATPLADVYAMACTWFHLLTSRPPFHAESLPGILYRHQHEPLPDPRRFAEDIPESISRVLARAGAKSAAERHASAEALLADINAILDPRDASRPPHIVMPPPPSPTIASGTIEHPTTTLAIPASPPAVAPMASGASQTRRYAIAAGVVLCLCVLVVIAAWQLGWFGSPPRQVASTAMTSQPATAPRPAIAAMKGAPTAREFTNSIGMTFARVEPGVFTMGSPETEEARTPDESQHRVTLTRPYYIGVTKVTQAQWEKVMKGNPSHFRGADDLPVEGETWDDAVEFCRYLSAADGQSYRLPTEAEWEYAARAGTTTPFATGYTMTTDQANFNGQYSYGDGPPGVFRQQTTPVRYFPPTNAWGLYDMQGNLCEWCNDFYGPYPPGDVKDPKGPASGADHVTRNGSWSGHPRWSRSAARSLSPANTKTDRLGVRVVLEVRQ